MVAFAGSVTWWRALVTGAADLLSRGLAGRWLPPMPSAWQRASLSAKFAAVSAPVLLLGMLAVGNWVSTRVAEGVVQNHAAAAVLYVDSFIAPRVQALAKGPVLPAADMADLERLIAPELASGRIAGYRVWSRDAIIFSDNKDLIGRHFELSEDRRGSWDGAVKAELFTESHDHGEGAGDVDPAVKDGEPLLEIYAPIREAGTGRVIALAESYERVPGLAAELANARNMSWQLVSLIGLAMFAAQFLIVNNGTRTIQAQESALNARIGELTRMLNENNSLRFANQAGQRAADMNERYLRQIGADLHDGPLQLMGTTVLHLDSLDATLDEADKHVAAEARQDIGAIRQAVRGSLTELRDLASGFMPPEFERLDIADTLDIAVERHQQRTRQKVVFTCDDHGAPVGKAVKTCLFRFVQEGLNNSWRHARDTTARVMCRNGETGLEILVEDRGPGFDPNEALAGRNGLGLLGLRERVVSLGGQFTITSAPGAGTQIRAVFDRTFLDLGT